MGRTIGKNLPHGHMTFVGLAKATGVPADTLRRWYKAGELKHAYREPYGKVEVAIFTLDSIVQVKKLRDEKNSSLNTDS